jgi:hypothetical protein
VIGFLSFHHEVLGVYQARYLPTLAPGAMAHPVPAYRPAIDNSPDVLTFSQALEDWHSSVHRNSKKYTVDFADPTKNIYMPRFWQFHKSSTRNSRPGSPTTARSTTRSTTPSHERSEAALYLGGDGCRGFVDGAAGARERQPVGSRQSEIKGSSYASPACPPSRERRPLAGSTSPLPAS